MNKIMNSFRADVKVFGNHKITRIEDFSQGLNGLPKSDVIKFHTNFGSVVVRPSGTEPKIKTYISVTASDECEAREIESSVNASLSDMMK